MKKFHPLHMTEISPWPLIGSLVALSFMLSLITMMHFKLFMLLSISLTAVLLIMFSWWRDVVRESKLLGDHNFVAQMKNLKLGMILFIASEVLFFVSFFWAYFHNSIIPSMEIGQIWPPIMIKSLNPMNIPLLNTVLLLSSGVSITWSHHLLMKNNMKLSKLCLLITIVLGAYFSMLQLFEYIETEFSLADAIYGSSFFMATGFHGLHVLIGSTFLMITWTRMNKMEFANNHTIGFETAAWYWHFVDVVWLFLFTAIYWWGM